MRFIIHIGLRKTGTTAIQKFFCNNADCLLTQSILYPTIGRLGRKAGGGRFAHHNLVWSLSDKPQLKTIWPDLHREVEQSSASVVFISAETFSTAPKETISKLHRETAGYDVEIVLVTRNLIDLAKSEYSQQIKKGRTSDNFLGFVRKNDHLWNLPQILDNWAGVFGEDRVLEVRYEELSEIDFVSAFLAKSKIPLLTCAVTTTERQNISPNSSALAVIRMFNRSDSNFPLYKPVMKILRNSIAKGRSVGQIVSFMAKPLTMKELITDDEIAQTNQYLRRFRS